MAGPPQHKSLQDPKAFVRVQIQYIRVPMIIRLAYTVPVRAWDVLVGEAAGCKLSLRACHGGIPTHRPFLLDGSGSTATKYLISEAMKRLFCLILKPACMPRSRQD